MTVTNSAATNLANQKKLVVLSTGRLVACYHDTTTNAKFMYSDDGNTWTDYAADIAGATDGSMSVYTDSGGTERIVFSWKQSGTGGGRTDQYTYVNAAALSSDKSTITWNTAAVISTNSLDTWTDMVAHAEGTGGTVHYAISFVSGTTNNPSYFRSTINSSGAPAAGAFVQLLGGSYGVSIKVRPSIDLDSSKNLYVAWSAGATGAGKGIRFRKAVYSAGSWTWNTERELDSTRKADSADQAEYVICRYDSVNSVAMILANTDDGTNADMMLYQRDAADTTTTTYTLFNDASGDNRATYGSLAIDIIGNCYIFGREETTGNYIQYVKWTRTSGTTGSIGSFTRLDDVSFTTPYVNAIYYNNYIHYIYTAGSSSPYNVKYANFFSANNANISAPVMTATARVESPIYINATIVDVPTSPSTAQMETPGAGGYFDIPPAISVTMELATPTARFPLIGLARTSNGIVFFPQSTPNLVVLMDSPTYTWGGADPTVFIHNRNDEKNISAPQMYTAQVMIVLPTTSNILILANGVYQWNGIGGIQYLPSFPQLSRKETIWPFAT